jgi:hypothetical protein
VGGGGLVVTLLGGPQVTHRFGQAGHGHAQHGHRRPVARAAPAEEREGEGRQP